MKGIIDRCPTGVVGFDRLCEGGFVRNSDNLIVGGPGSGKSTFLLQFLWNGVTLFGENGLYCSFEPDIVDTLNDSMMHGWDFSRLSEEGKIKFMRFAPQTSIEELKKELTRVISKYNVRRICFDPVSVLALNLNEQGKIRQTIFDLSSLMKRLKVTTIFADESMGDEMSLMGESGWTKTDILKFLSDSVSIFYESPIAGVGDRAVRITKMRRTAHKREVVGMKISDNGVEVLGQMGEVHEEKNIKSNIIPAPVIPSPKVAVNPKTEESVAPPQVTTKPVYTNVVVPPKNISKTVFSSSNVVT